MKKIFFICILFVFFGCNDNHHMSVNDKFGFDSVYNAKENTLKIASHDDYFVLFFFSTMCDACANQIPIMNKIAKNTKVIGIMDDTMGFDVDIGILKSKGVEFITTSNPKSVKFFQNIVGGISGTPVSVFYDNNGKKIKQITGLYTLDEFKEIIKK